jgi:hypothetical protein
MRFFFVIYLLFYVSVKLCLLVYGKKHRFREFKEKMLRKVFVLTEEKTALRKLHKEEFHNLYFSPI